MDEDEKEGREEVCVCGKMACVCVCVTLGIIGILRIVLSF